jgi:hypothetical protein
MAHTPYTGAKYGATVKIGVTAIPRWKQIVIAEKFRPLPDAMDATDSADTSWQYIDNPLGGKGTPSVTITVSGLKSKTGVHDTNILQTTALNAVVTLTVQKGTGAGADLFTFTGGRYKSYVTPHELGSLVPYTAVFEQAANAGVWSASLS